MARMLTAADVEAAAKAGQPLQLAAGDRLTPLARDRAKELGVALLEGGAPAGPAAAAPAPVPLPADPAPSLPAPPAGSGTPFVLPPSGAMYRRSALGPAAPRAGGRDARPKAGVVGAGHVGAMTALRLAESDLFSEVAMVDVVPGLAEGLALDMWHGAGLYGFSTRLAGSSDLAALAGAEYIVMTAGKPRQPGMSRTDLNAVNAGIMQAVAAAIRQQAPQATLVVVSNPLEEMTHLAAQVTGFPDERVLGMAGVLDSARFCALVGLTGRFRPQQVRALALGSHGPEMVIPLSQATADGQPIEKVFDAEVLAAIVERTRDSGAEVVRLLQKGSAYFSPAESAAAMVRAMVRESGEVIAACVRSRGAYGTADTRVGLPVRLGRRGLKEIVTLSLRADEVQALKAAAGRIAARIAALPAAAGPGA
jgi:malate dehydrogenase